ncbi:MAG: hypothetical protein P9L99_02990 [Candidatus Lernaella stagnicola]|nr:hypothetical protein [Candidatus Lernaella stagnicola]
MVKFQRLTWDELTPSLQRRIPPDVPPAKRIAMAKGLIPLGTKELLIALFFLSGDKDKRVAKEAQKSLKELPESLILIGISGETNPKLLHFIATRGFDNNHIYEQVALHRNVAAATLAYLAETSRLERVLTIIAGNERAILQSPPILLGLVVNPSTPRSVIDRLTRFYEIEKGHAFDEDLTPEQRERLAQPAGVEQAAPPPGPEKLVIPDDRMHPCVRIADLAGAEFDTDMLFADDLMQDEEDDDEPVTPENAEKQQKKTKSIMSRLAKLNMVDKLLLAMKGNREARRILLRNPNKIIQEAVLQNPRITIREVLAAVKEKTTPQNVVERICNNREWTRYYEVQLQLCCHPKTPMRFVFRALQRLNPRDVERLAFNRGVPGATRAQALNILRRRKRT